MKVECKYFTCRSCERFTVDATPIDGDQCKDCRIRELEEDVAETSRHSEAQDNAIVAIAEALGVSTFKLNYELDARREQLVARATYLMGEAEESAQYRLDQAEKMSGLSSVMRSEDDPAFGDVAMMRKASKAELLQMYPQGPFINPSGKSDCVDENGNLKFVVSGTEEQLAHFEKGPGLAARFKDTTPAAKPMQEPVVVCDSGWDDE